MTNFCPIPFSPVVTQHSWAAEGLAPRWSLSIFFAAKRWECEGSMTQDLEKKPTPPSAPQLSAFHSSPPLFAGLSLQADHVPEYHRSLSSHSLRSCNLLRPRSQKAALPLVMVCSLFFNIFLKGRGAQAWC